MAGILIAVGLFVGIVLIGQFDRILGAEPATDRPSYPTYPADQAYRPSNFDEALKLHQAEAAISMERELIARRYSQQHTAILARLWTRLMGFLTGMALAIVGASFVLGRLREPASSVSGKGSGVDISIKSASPGVILAVVGALMMALTITIPINLEESVTPTYFMGDRAAMITALSKPGVAPPASGPVGLDADVASAPPHLK
jgi:hypothetical protein